MALVSAHDPHERPRKLRSLGRWARLHHQRYQTRAGQCKKASIKGITFLLVIALAGLLILPPPQGNTQENLGRLTHRKEAKPINLDLLKQLLAQANITQTELARVMGKHRTNVNMKLNGHLSFTVEETEVIFDLLGIDDPSRRCEILYGKKACSLMDIRGNGLYREEVPQ